MSVKPETTRKQRLIAIPVVEGYTESIRGISDERVLQCVLLYRFVATVLDLKAMDTDQYVDSLRVACCDDVVKRSTDH